MLPLRVHHLALRTQDVEGLASFYARVFGLARISASRAGGVWLALDGGVLMIEKAEGDEPGIPEGSMDFLAFSVTPEAREAFAARLKRLGLSREASTEHTIYLRDPDGRRVGVSSFALDDALVGAPVAR